MEPSFVGHFIGSPGCCLPRFCPRSVNCVLRIRQERGVPEHYGNAFQDNSLGRNFSSCAEDGQATIHPINTASYTMDLSGRREY